MSEAVAWGFEPHRPRCGPGCGNCDRNEQECVRSYPCCSECDHDFAEGDTADLFVVPEPSDPAVVRAREARRLALINADPDYLPEPLLDAAVRLVAAVRTRVPETVRSELVGSSRADLYALAVCLAAMVPTTCSTAELLAWNDGQYAVKPVQPLRPHGTHAAYVRHKTRREEPCEPCVLAERIYQRNRKRRKASATHNAPLSAGFPVEQEATG